MEQLKSILAVIERHDRAPDVLARAIILARHFGARVELFMCDADSAEMPRHAQDALGPEEARRERLGAAMRFLESLRQSVMTDDIPIALDAACESPLYEGIVRKVLRSTPDIVVKGVSDNSSNPYSALDSNDLQLVRTCPAPLLLVQGSQWDAWPRLAALVDISEVETAGLARTVFQTASFIARGSAGELDIVYGEGAARTDNVAANVDARKELRALAEEFGIAEERQHFVKGEPGEVLQQFTLGRTCDVLILSAWTYCRALTALVGTKGARLLSTVDCDYLLVKPDRYAGAHAPARGGHDAVRFGSSGAVSSGANATAARCGE